MELVQTEVFQKWLGKINDKKLQGLVAARLFRLANDLPGDVKSVGQGVSELRIHYGKGYRIYFKKKGKAIIVLLCGGDKGTQEADIRRAQELAKEV